MANKQTDLRIRGNTTSAEFRDGLRETDAGSRRLADLGLSGAATPAPTNDDAMQGDTIGEPNEDHRLDDRLEPTYASVDEISLSEAELAVDGVDTDFEAGDKERTHTEPRFAFVSPTDEDAQYESARQDSVERLNAELDEPLPEIRIETDAVDSVRAFPYYEGPCGATIVSAPTRDMDAAEGDRRLTVIESPLAGNVALNVAYAKAAMLDALDRGEAPFASHLLYAQSGLLDDADPIERGRGIMAGLAWSRFADRCAVYTDLGISSGMGLGIATAQSYGIPIEWRTLGEDAVRDLMKTYGKP